MNNFLNQIIYKLGTIENSYIFAFSIVPYLIFLYYLYKNNIFNWLIKLGFSLTIVFVFITILITIVSLNIYGKTLVEVDFLHGIAESFLTIADLVILLGFSYFLNSKQVKNS